LSGQLTDLNTALETLDEAIRKIDRETKTRFKETFEKVNSGFQVLFPRLFGGGNALLELTGEDLLETGVNIIARPPGKRPASIGLLSGGEKALTAVALIFAIQRPSVCWMRSTRRSMKPMSAASASWWKK
jgi:chromosome segregation protein